MLSESYQVTIWKRRRIDYDNCDAHADQNNDDKKETNNEDDNDDDDSGNIHEEGEEREVAVEGGGDCGLEKGARMNRKRD